MNNNPEKVLHFFGAMKKGGAESMILEHYSLIDRSKVQFDFVSSMKDGRDYDNQIYELGGKIFSLPSPKQIGFLKYILGVKKIIKENGPYKAVHSHALFRSAPVMIGAFLSGVKIRISHSHTTQSSFYNKNHFIVFIVRFFINLFSTSRLACTEKSGELLFGKNAVKKEKFEIFKNAINLDSFLNFDKSVNDIKKEFNIETGQTVLIHIGRFIKQKNHDYLLKIADLLKKQNYSFKMLFVGNGKFFDDIKSNVLSSEYCDNIIFTGIRNDIAQLLSLSDIFLFPSLYEGLPVALVESQALGVCSIVSSKVDTICDAGLNLISFIDINDSDLHLWVEKIIQLKSFSKPDPEIIKQKFKESQFNAADNIKNLYRIYDINP